MPARRRLRIGFHSKFIMSSLLQLYKYPLRTIVGQQLRVEPSEDEHQGIFQERMDIAKAAITRADHSFCSIMDPRCRWSNMMHSQHHSALFGLRMVHESSCAELWKCIESTERLAIAHAFVMGSCGGIKKLRGMYIMSRGERSVLRYDTLHYGHIVETCMCRNCFLKKMAQVAILCPALMDVLEALPLEAKDIIAATLADV